ncbi:hypothetical protein [Allosphingosinicella humi]
MATMETARQTASDAQMRYLDSGDMTKTACSFALDFEAMNAMLAVSVVREAFVTSAFHYWEISGRGWTGISGQHDTFNTLRNALVAGRVSLERTTTGASMRSANSAKCAVCQHKCLPLRFKRLMCR